MMQIERTFKIPVDEAAARERVVSYFSGAGYQKISEKGIGLSFRRGSKIGSWIALNPSQPLTIADVQIRSKGEGAEVRTDFEIKTLVKDDTHFTEKFWDEEMRDLETALNRGEYLALKSKHLTARAMLAIVKSLLVPLAYVIMWGALSLGLTLLVMRIPGFANTYPEIAALFSMAIAAIATFLVYRYLKRRRGIR
jgi:hypothetical protein